MTSKVHVQDTAVLERRLRPIYDWLDSGNHKKALQECDKVLKKTPNLQCAKALKSLALLRLGKESESVALLNSLVDEKPCDDGTLQAMTLCYRELQQLEKVCQLYETAVKIDPNNEELHTHLFMSYVRVFDYKSQQQSAMTLYKLKPKNPYYCWAVMSIILQATRGEGARDGKKRSLLLSLAERMMIKLISDNKLEAEQEVQLYVLILELLDKYEEILKVYDGPLGARLVCNNMTYDKLPYLVRLERWGEINVLCKGILVDSVDKWDVWKHYINSVFKLLPSTQTNNHCENHDVGDDLTAPDDTPDKAHEFICRLVENGADNGYLLRGPYLARFELCSKLSIQGLDSNDLLGDTTELFMEYFRKFGHKPCCVSDLKVYLNLLDVDKKAVLSMRLMKDVGISDTGVPQSEQQMQRHLCALQLSRLCGSHRNLSPEHLRAVITALSLHYQHGYQSYGQNVLSTDIGPADSYIILAAHALYDLAVTTKNYRPLYSALVLLDGLLKNSPSNFQAKLLGMRLYHTLGGALGANKIYNGMDVKHLQLDSLGYTHCARLPTTGLFREAASLYDTTLKFFTSNYRDSSDHLKFFYKFGSFIKLDEFMDFRERLNNSLHYTTIAIDRLILTLVQSNSLESVYNLDTSPKDTEIEWDKLRDNHDLSVCTSWDPERIECPLERSDDIRTAFEQDVSFLKLKSQVLYLFSSAGDLVRSNDGRRQKSLETLSKRLEEWEQLHRQAREVARREIKQNSIVMPLPSRLHSFMECPCVEVLNAAFRILIAVAEDNVEVCNGVVDELKTIFSKKIRNVNSFSDGREDFWTDRECMEYMVNLVETLSLASLIFLLCVDLVRPPQNKKAKRRTDTKFRDALNELNQTLREQIRRVDDDLECWNCLACEEELSLGLEMLNLNGLGYRDVLDNILQSHTGAVKELQTVLANRCKMLNGVLI